ncbi:MAG: hypothetical protein WKF76_08225 [Nocardioidaceae bacterium]
MAYAARQGRRTVARPGSGGNAARFVNWSRPALAELVSLLRRPGQEEAGLLPRCEFRDTAGQPPTGTADLLGTSQLAAHPAWIRNAAPLRDLRQPGRRGPRLSTSRLAGMAADVSATSRAAPGVAAPYTGRGWTLRPRMRTAGGRGRTAFNADADAPRQALRADAGTELRSEDEVLPVKDLHGLDAARHFLAWLRDGDRAQQPMAGGQGKGTDAVALPASTW